MKKLVAAMVMVLCLAGCYSTDYHIIEPIEPPTKGGYAFPYWYTEVESLSPHFQWKEIPGSTYDLIIYEAVMVQGMEAGWDKVASPGAEVFYEEDISEPQLALPIPLEPDTDYVWSVRARSASGVTEWATYDAGGTDYLTGGGEKAYRDLYFWIRTPK